MPGLKFSELVGMFENCPFFCCRLLAKAVAPYLIHKIARPKGSGFWLVAIQVIASFNLLLSIVVFFSLHNFGTSHIIYLFFSCRVS